MKVDYVIVGFGIAGVAFANQLEEQNKSFVVIDNGEEGSSYVAAGTYNPLVLKRYKSVWDSERQLAYALPFYKALENKFNDLFHHSLVSHKIFSSIEDQNNWFIASDQPIISKYMSLENSNDFINGIVTDFGFGTFTGTGWVNLKKLISNYKEYLNKHNKIITEVFEHSQISFEKDTVVYKGISAKSIVFCEGYGIKNNPYFNYLALNGSKGEVLTIYSPNLNITSQVKSSVFILPLGDGYYKVGATFNREDKTLIPTITAKEELIAKLDKLISVNYTIVSHIAGIRPTVNDRRPLLGVHPQFSQLAILNGMGTRGVMIAPLASKILYDHIEFNSKIDDEMSIMRFKASKRLYSKD